MSDPDENFEIKRQERIEAAEHIITSYLPREEGRQKTVIEAMNYSVLAGGKRLRPVLMREAYMMFGGRNEMVIGPFMAALEMIHTYSLVHDDLPALDNDEYRRGKKTTHAVYGPGMATIAGDGLLNFAFETALTAAHECQELPEYDGSVSSRMLAALTILAEKAGIFGMIGGQCADIEAEKRTDVTPDDLLFIHENKTGALIESALMIGAILAGASASDVHKMEQIGQNVGVAFQIQDDILDVIGDQDKLGKPVGSDEKNEKTTYVTFYGLEKSKEEVARLSDEALELLRELESQEGHEDIFLEELITWLIHRDN
ncbi:geranylgeranyl diphosphate synthase, type II [Butyrivibrio fibrisolvens DSM 3071]|uniref:Farnesyl diphosphate synthase n=1 Tax=Butyrivibrio fibrisolvens DSM 3071 TaxID=1121131 RepID=A0A1M6CF65_BUTFI|nr:farnesyl diphosphate synthase [Butyrivibrio fibrisolvens]SHI59675.1 geranylgeranyl diphosphate synthase, type II [Butyrivibrio fibrisolvens DSM 3071]